MKSFKQFVVEKEDVEFQLDEALITFADQAYPTNGHVVIMAGGAGSGKGFVLDKLVGMEGKVFDVDALKSLATRTPKLIKTVKDNLGIDISKFDPKNDPDVLKNPDNVGMLHDIIGNELNLPNKQQQAFFTSVLTSHPSLKPNIIFDVTLKDMRKLDNITRHVQNLGYDKKNIHIVWTVNDIEVAIQQNKERERVVPIEILINTHRGVSSTMNDIIKMGAGLKKYMDGDIVLAFNQRKVDSTLEKSGRGGEYIKDVNYVHIKKSGQPVNKISEIGSLVLRKIDLYVPKNIDWLKG